MGLVLPGANIGLNQALPGPFDSIIMKGTWTAEGTVTLPAITLGGAVTYGAGISLLDATAAGITIGLGASAPAPDNATVHIWKATAGAVVATAGTLLVLENSSDAYLTLLTPSANESGILFGNPVSSSQGYLIYRGSDHPTTPNELRVQVAGDLKLRYSAGAFAFQEAITISTTAGDLTLNPTGLVVATRPKFGTASVSAVAANRGVFYFTEAAGGVADKLYCIMKSTADTYSAIQVAIG